MFIYLLLTSALQSNMNRISGVMVIMLTSSAMGSNLRQWIVICCFSAKHTASSSKDWLVL